MPTSKSIENTLTHSLIKELLLGTSLVPDTVLGTREHSSEQNEFLPPETGGETSCTNKQMYNIKQQQIKTMEDAFN